MARVCSLLWLLCIIKWLDYNHHTCKREIGRGKAVWRRERIDGVGRGGENRREREKREGGREEEREREGRKGGQGGTKGVKSSLFGFHFGGNKFTRGGNK